MIKKASMDVTVKKEPQGLPVKGLSGMNGAAPKGGRKSECGERRLAA